MKLGRNDMCWCGSGKKYKTCHLALDDKLEDMKNRGFKIPTHAMIKNAEQIEARVGEGIEVKYILNLIPGDFNTLEKEILVVKNIEKEDLEIIVFYASKEGCKNG